MIVRFIYATKRSLFTPFGSLFDLLGDGPTLISLCLKFLFLLDVSPLFYFYAGEHLM
uniref:Uncharacterized protein n=1 Tax=Rhizophora mucronata TaxID=61149 RepID=A0A2P2N4T2_RHIMU